MSKQEEDAFRVAFVVFVVSTLLSPSAKHDYASVDYWNALEDPSSISKYDWSEYVMTRLLDAVTKLKQNVSSSKKFPIITGCSLFLQVFPFFLPLFIVAAFVRLVGFLSDIFCFNLLRYSI